MSIDRPYFFDSVRNGLFGTMSQSQVDGCEAILTYWDESYSSNPLSFLAYILATTFHETDKAMQPVRERGGDAYLIGMYDIRGSRPAVAKNLGNVNPGDGVKYAGAGLVQITGRSNYAKMGALCGVNLVGNPSLALNDAVAIKILFEGMFLGSFTGKKLSSYLPSDPLNARRIINGMDKAQTIEGYYMAFSKALRAGSASTITTAPVTTVASNGSWFSKISSIFARKA